MAACDFRVVAEDTVLAIPEIDMGLPYTWGGVARLVHELGPSLARDLIMTGRRFRAAEVAPFGFVQRVVAGDDLEEKTSALARELLAKPQLALELVKRQFRAAGEQLMADSSADPRVTSAVAPRQPQYANAGRSRFPPARRSRSAETRGSISRLTFASRVPCRARTPSIVACTRGRRSAASSGARISSDVRSDVSFGTAPA